MRKILLVLVISLLSLNVFAAPDMDQIISNYGQGEIQVNIWYFKIDDPLHGVYAIPYEKNPITLSNIGDKAHIPYKEGYFIIINDVSQSQKRTSFSNCNNYFGVKFGYGYSIIEVGYPDQNGSIGYCGAYPNPGESLKSLNQINSHNHG